MEAGDGNTNRQVNHGTARLSWSMEATRQSTNQARNRRREKLNPRLFQGYID
jgi:hypothetical protein